MGKNKHKQCTWCPFLCPQMSATDAHAYHLCSPCSLFSLSALSGPVSFCPFLHPPFIYAFRSSSRNARQAVRGTSHACRSSRQQNLSIFNNGRNPGCGYDAINFSISQPPFPDPRWRRRGGRTEEWHGTLCLQRTSHARSASLRPPASLKDRTRARKALDGCVHCQKSHGSEA